MANSPKCDRKYPVEQGTKTIIANSVKVNSTVQSSSDKFTAFFTLRSQILVYQG
ncbi:MAG TPA: hypothetical protein V6D15_11645 [Oculatellaceae cyanobacterium]